jgi:hypothetical protein
VLTEVGAIDLVVVHAKVKITGFGRKMRLTNERPTRIKGLTNQIGVSLTERSELFDFTGIGGGGGRFVTSYS